MRSRVIVPDGEYIIKSENSIGNAPEEWTPLVRCRECKYMDAVYPYCNAWENVTEEDGYCYKGEKDE